MQRPPLERLAAVELGDGTIEALLDGAKVIERPVAAGSEHEAAGEPRQRPQNIDRARRQRHRMALVGFHAPRRDHPQRATEIDLAPDGLAKFGPAHTKQQQ